MKKLTLGPILEKKLSRLQNKAREISYLGADLNDAAHRPTVAIVGTRKPTPYGKAITQRIAQEAARAGIVVVSGNALGVDVIAQKAALEAGGTVTSVLPSGLDKIYPASNRPVAEAIVASGGSLISEYEPGHIPTRYDFLERNRLIAALSDLVIIPEAAKGSGSLNTAKHATSMQIPIACPPGHITSPMSEGTNQLLKDGAHLITDPADILHILGIDNTTQTSLDLTGDDEAQSTLLQLLADGVSDTIELQAKSGLASSEFQMALSMLEVDGRISQQAAHTWQLVK